jgi:hypothetical protein
VEIQTVEQVQYIHQDSIYEIEKWFGCIRRCQHRRNWRCFNLLQKIETLQKELVEVKTGYACMKIKITFLTQAE